MKLSLLVAALVALSVTACGKPAPAPEAAPAPAAEAAPAGATPPSAGIAPPAEPKKEEPKK